MTGDCAGFLALVSRTSVSYEVFHESPDHRSSPFPKLRFVIVAMEYYHEKLSQSVVRD